MKKKILILYTSIGLGHKYIALNITHHLQNNYEVRTFDVLQLKEGMLVNLGTWLHSFINRRLPFVWRWLYFSRLFTKVTLPLRVPLAGRNYRHIKKVVTDFKPDVIITTQTTASAAIAYMKRAGEFQGKFVIAFSDYHLHRYWLYAEADFYLANIIEQKNEMVQLGISPEKIAVCGITLLPYKKSNLESVKQAFQIGEYDSVILIASGSLGVGFTAENIQRLISGIVGSVTNSKVIVVCGKNEDLFHELSDMKINKAIILPFYENMSELYEVSDVILTKPGGLSVAEALQSGIKIVITHWLPGQEELNYRYLLNNGLVSPLVNLENIDSTIVKIMGDLESETKGETKLSDIITQKNHEGMVLCEAIDQVIVNA